MKSFLYQQDENKPEQPAKLTFKGVWSRSDLDRMTKLALRGLRQYKADMIRKENKDATRRTK